MHVVFLCVFSHALCRFKKLDADGSGSLSWEELMDIPELGQNPLVQRVVGKLWGDVDIKDLHIIYFLRRIRR